MIDPRTATVLGAMTEAGVKCLLTGGQACVIYGGAEFSKDVDFNVLADGENFARLQKVAAALEAETIAVPPFEKRFLDEGLAIHLRCGLPAVSGFRVDLMSRMRGVAPFSELWARRTTVDIGPLKINLMSVRDLVQSKKTQRSKDWPMIQRLLEVHYLQRRSGSPDPRDVQLWLTEMLTPELVIEVTQLHEKVARSLELERPLLKPALIGDIELLRSMLTEEIEAEKAADRRYWEPLKARLGDLRRASRGDNSHPVA
jgi:hypothetical protein